MLSLISFIFLFNFIFVIKSQPLNCSNEHPTVHVFTSNRDIEINDFLYPTQNPNSDKIISVENEETFGRQVVTFGCTHHTPIEWKVDIFDPKDFELKKSLSWHKTVSGSQRFFSAFQLQRNSSRKNTTPIIFACQASPFETDCHQSLIRLEAKGHTTPVQLTISNLEALTSIPNDSNFGNKSTSECDFLLHYRPLPPNSMQYKWKTNLSSFEPFVKKTIQPVYFQGMYRSVIQEPQCVELIPPDESCPDCSIISDRPGEPKANGDGLIFYAQSSNKKVVFKGVFGIAQDAQTPKRFFWEWEFQINAMVQLNINPASKFYLNKTEVVNCTVSTLYFSYGTIVRTSEDDLASPFSYPSDEEERYIPDSMRNITKHITFYDDGPNKTVSCFAPLRDYAKMITKSVDVIVEVPLKPKIVNLLESEESQSATTTLITNAGELNKSLTCEFEGNPAPVVEWTLPSEDLRSRLQFYTTTTEHQIKSTMIIPVVEDAFEGSYICQGKNYLGEASKTFKLEFPSGLSRNATIGLSVGLGAVTILCLTILGVLYRRIILQRKEFETKTANAIREFKEGMRLKQKEDKFNMIEADAKTQHHVSIMEQPYNEEYEVPIDLWTIEDKFLGQGAFGYVREGRVRVENKSIQVAVKMLKSAVEIEDFKNFLFELKIMAYIGHHPNIVSLVAACTQNIDQRDVMIGVEFCTNGSLMDYLVNKRCMFKRNTKFSTTNDSEETAISGGMYSNLVHCVGLTDHDLYIWSYQIASGMEFLSSKRVLHGDLATRNVLLTLDKTAKISDFGLSRILVNTSNYTKKSKVPLPWKWMAVESLISLTFSGASDVWAYGVTLWEIFSLGEVPYAGLHFCPEFVEQLKQGLRLAKPSKATDYVYGVMKRCWEETPGRRITFDQLKSTFTYLLETLNNPDGETTLPPIPTPRRIDIGSSNILNTLGIDQLYTNVPRSSNLYLNV